MEFAAGLSKIVYCNMVIKDILNELVYKFIAQWTFPCDTIQHVVSTCCTELEPDMQCE